MSTQFIDVNQFNVYKEVIESEQSSSEVKEIISTDGKPFSRENFQCDSNQNKSCKKKFKCSVCQKDFLRRYEFTRHLRTHSEGRPYKCEQCGKYYKQVECLKNHQKTHNPSYQNKSCQEAFKCSVCPKVFSKRFDYTRHMRIHSEGRPYKCDQCPKDFKQLNYLKQHQQKTHNQKRQYKCEQCPKSFSKLDTLLRHQIIHSGEKPHECKQCQKKFSQLYHLKQHQVIHTDEKNFKCMQCEKCFTRFSYLKDHQMTECGKTPLQCKDCPKVFYHLSTIRRHERKVHSARELHKNSHINNNNLPFTDDKSLKHEEPSTSLSQNSLIQHFCDININTQFQCSSCNQCQANCTCSESLTKSTLIQSNETSPKCETSPNIRFQSFHLDKEAFESDNESKSKIASFSSDQNQQRLQISLEEKEFKCYLCSFDCNNDLNLGLHYLSHLDNC